MITEWVHRSGRSWRSAAAPGRRCPSWRGSCRGEGELPAPGRGGRAPHVFSAIRDHVRAGLGGLRGPARAVGQGPAAAPGRGPALLRSQPRDFRITLPSGAAIRAADAVKDTVFERALVREQVQRALVRGLGARRHGQPAARDAANSRRESATVLRVNPGQCHATFVGSETTMRAAAPERERPPLRQ